MLKLKKVKRQSSLLPTNGGKKRRRWAAHLLTPSQRRRNSMGIGSKLEPRWPAAVAEAASLLWRPGIDIKSEGWQAPVESCCLPAVVRLWCISNIPKATHCCSSCFMFGGERRRSCGKWRYSGWIYFYPCVWPGKYICPCYFCWDPFGFDPHI